MISFLLRLFRSIIRFFARLFRFARKPLRPNFDKPGSWASFVKSWKFDQLHSSRKPAAFRQIMSFRS